MTDSVIADPAQHQDESSDNWRSPLDSDGAMGASGPTQDIDLVMDIPVTLSVELGRTRVPIRQILQLAQGSVIELETMAGDPMDVFVNGCLIAKGEVVVVNEKFGIRLTDIVTPAERMRRMGKA